MENRANSMLVVISKNPFEHIRHTDKGVLNTLNRFIISIVTYYQLYLLSHVLGPRIYYRRLRRILSGKVYSSTSEKFFLMIQTL